MKWDGDMDKELSSKWINFGVILKWCVGWLKNYLKVYLS
jgi:hypothetical protein